MDEARVLVLRLSGELSIKARATRKQFTDRLLHNLRDALASAGLAARIERRHERILVHTTGVEAEPARAALQRVFGLQSLSLAACGTGETLAAVVEDGARHFEDAVAQKTFAVRARRVGAKPAPGASPGNARGNDARDAKRRSSSGARGDATCRTTTRDNPARDAGTRDATARDNQTNHPTTRDSEARAANSRNSTPRPDKARAVATRSDDKSHAAAARGVAPAAREVERALGARLLPHARGVNLSHPEVTAHVELFEDRAYFFHEQTRAPGGLPLGTGGRAVALVSGGFDSAVAAWQIQRRGVRLDFVFCNLGGALHRHGVLRVMHEFARLWGHGAPARLHVIPFAELALELQSAARPRHWQVLLKRRMLRAAEQVAREVRARALVTGEALGQVSSQTLANLQTISTATALPILRPLVGMNKDDIIAQAQRIGTGALSALVDEYCALTRKNPATAAKVADVDAAEARLDFARLEKTVAEREQIDLRACDPDATGLPELETTRVPEDAVVIDLRPRRAFDAWHHPDAVHLNFATALAACASFEKRKPYVAVCEYGLMSAHLAEQMRAAGLVAFHFRGGARALRRWLEERGRANKRGASAAPSARA